MPEAEELFYLLDVDQDEMLTRKDLHQAAQSMPWFRFNSPLFAVLDLLTIGAGLSKNTFKSYLEQILNDGPYGNVLLHSNVFEKKSNKCTNSTPDDLEIDTGSLCNADSPGTGEGTGDIYRKALQELACPRLHIPLNETALLIIDPQRSFTSGIWMQSLGTRAQLETAPIRRAFKNCSRLLSKLQGCVDTMFTRCPFPPGSYEWDGAIEPLIDPSQLYFLKPGNSVMWPPTNGFREWVEGLLIQGKKTLIIGGCTLNSCVRVSALETLAFFGSRGLRVVVDLNLCAARSCNATPSPQFGGLSSVEAAVCEMREAGVDVISACFLTSQMT